jgi:hypothetical protein
MAPSPHTRALHSSWGAPRRRFTMGRTRGSFTFGSGGGVRYASCSERTNSREMYCIPKTGALLDFRSTDDRDQRRVLWGGEKAKRKSHHNRPPK